MRPARCFASLSSLGLLALLAACPAPSTPTTPNGNTQAPECAPAEQTPEQRAALVLELFNKLDDTGLFHVQSVGAAGVVVIVPKSICPKPPVVTLKDEARNALKKAQSNTAQCPPPPIVIASACLK